MPFGRVRRGTAARTGRAKGRKKTKRKERVHWRAPL
jgi:hypothetical protein